MPQAHPGTEKSRAAWRDEFPVFQHKTDVIASHVCFTSGLIQDIAVLAGIAREAGAHLLAEACQSVGQLPLDARRFEEHVVREIAALRRAGVA